MEDRHFQDMPQHVKDNFEEQDPKTLRELMKEHGPDHKIRMLTPKGKGILSKHRKRVKAGSAGV